MTPQQQQLLRELAEGKLGKTPKKVLAQAVLDLLEALKDAQWQAESAQEEIASLEDRHCEHCECYECRIPWS